jgi:hypothetical protein
LTYYSKAILYAGSEGDISIDDDDDDDDKESEPK